MSTVAPRVSVSSNQLMAEEDQTIAIACSVTGQPPPTITWSKAIGSLPGTAAVNNGVLKINNESRKDGGVYICKAKNILGTAVTTAQLTAVAGNPLHLPCVAERVV